MPERLSVPHFLQLADGYCLPACVQMVLAFWGIKAEQGSIARRLSIIPGIGAPGSRLHLLASPRLQVVYRSGELSDLELALDEGIPPIALVHTKELPYWEVGFAHAVVIVGISGEQIFITDPGKPQLTITVSVGDFELAWDEMHNLYGLLRPIQ